MPTLVRVPLTALLLLLAAGGCLRRDARLTYCGDADLQHYKDVATSVDYPTVPSANPEQVIVTTDPRTIVDRENAPVRDIELTEIIHLALQNNPIIRTDGQFLSPGNALLTGGERVPSIYDPAIQESGVLFGTRGVEAALSAFDPRVSASILWGRDESVQNNQFFAGGLQSGNTLMLETAEFQSQLSKQFAYGGQFSVFHHWDYRGTNVPGQLFPSVYTGMTGAEYRQPLLAGSGTRFTRIAGPIADAFGGLTGVSQGVVIARINNDISIAEFEQSVHVLLKETEDLYWNLHLAYRLYDTAIVARNSALRSWREAELKRLAGGVVGFKLADEAQARDQYYQAKALAEQALSEIYEIEIRLRRLVGLPVNDGTVLRPATEPTTAPFRPDWELCLVEALTRRVELRRQKFTIKSLELQLEAARSLVRPRLDVIGNYRVNAFGDKLLEYDDDDKGMTAQGLNSAYETLTQGDQTGWGLGLEFTMNLGFRSAVAQVRNLELRLAKARDVLATMEMDIAHELAFAVQNLTEQYRTAQSHWNRIRPRDPDDPDDRGGAAQEFLRLATAEYEAGVEDATLDLVLRAQAVLAEAQRDYFTSIVQYNQAISDVFFRKGTLLDLNSVQLAEGEWTPEAYQDALRRAWARSHAFPNPLLRSEPLEFVLPHYDGQHILPPTAEDLGPAPQVDVPPAPENGEAAEPMPPEYDPSTEPRPIPLENGLPENGQPGNDRLPGASDAGEPLPALPPAAAIRPIGDTRSAASHDRPPAWLGPFFDDEHLAPFEEDLELRPGRDLLR